MWSCQDGCSVTDFAIYRGRCAFSRIHIEFFRIARQHLHALIGIQRGIDKNASSIIVAPKDVRDHADVQSRLGDFQFRRPRAGFAVVDEPGKGTAATRTGEESQLSVPDHRHLLVTDLEFAPLAPVVPAGAKAQVGASPLDELRDPSVTLAIEGLAISQIRAAGHDEHGARGRPWLLDDHVRGHRDDRIVGSQETAEGVEAVADGFHGASIAWRWIRQNILPPSRLGERTGIDEDVEPLGGQVVVCGHRRRLGGDRCCTACSVENDTPPRSSFHPDGRPEPVAMSRNEKSLQGAVQDQDDEPDEW